MTTNTSAPQVSYGTDGNVTITLTLAQALALESELLIPASYDDDGVMFEIWQELATVKDNAPVTPAEIDAAQLRWTDAHNAFNAAPAGSDAFIAAAILVGDAERDYRTICRRAGLYGA